MAAPITVPKMTVLMDDGKTHQVSLSYKAQMQYGRTSRINRWPSADKAPEMAVNFQLWYVLSQQMGIYPDMPYEDFEDHVVWASDVTEEELAEDDEDYPTSPATGEES